VIPERRYREAPDEGDPTCAPGTVTTTSLLLSVLATAASATPAEAGGAACRGVPATIVGTDRGETLRGTPGRDVVLARGGPDTIVASGGNDRVCAGRGYDVLLGGVGDEDLHGGPDGVVAREDQYGDELTGGPGDDLLDGGTGVQGNRGYDILRYPDATAGVVVDLGRGTARTGDQRDIVRSIEEVEGTPHDDVLRGDEHYNFLGGYRGDDRLYGRGGRDFVFTDADDDEAYGGPGDDLLDGGSGTDAAFGGSNGRQGDDCRSFEQVAGCEI